MIKIRNAYGHGLIYESDAKTVAAAVEAGIREGVSFEGAFFYEVDFTAANLKGGDFTGGIFRKCNMAGADMSGANISDASFFMCDFSRTRLHGVVSGENGVVFHYCYMPGVRL